MELIVQIAKLQKKKTKLREDLAKCEEEIVELSMQVAEHQATCKMLFCKNYLLNKRLGEITKRNHKGKSEGSRI